MPPPVSYIDITAVPFSRLVTQAEFNVANAIWFRYVATETIVLGTYTNAGGTFSPKVNYFESDGSTLITATSFAVGKWYLLTAGTYYIKVTRRFPNEANPSDFDFTTQFDTRPVNPVPAFSSGDILINDDNSSEFAAAVLSPSGAVTGFFPDVPTGEIGDSLPDGTSLIYDAFGKYASKRFILIDTSLRWVATLNLGITSFSPHICNDGTDFYVLNGNTGELWRVTAAGAATSIGTIPIGGTVQALGVSRDGDLFYWTRYSSTSIHVYQLSTTTVLADLYTVPGMTVSDAFAENPNVNPGELLVLPDGSMVTWWIDDSASDAATLLHISDAGVLLNSYSYTPPLSINHLHYEGSGSDKVKIWFYTDSGFTVGRLATLELATGTLSPSFDVTMFSTGVGMKQSTGDIFGPSNSCPMMTLGYGIATVTPPGSSSPPVNNSIPCCGCDCAHGGTPGDTLPEPDTAPLPEWTIRCGGGGVYPAGTPVTHSEDWRV